MIGKPKARSEPKASEVIELERTVRAPAEKIWAILVDHEGMPAWSGAREVVRRRPGRDEPNGLDAVRVVRIAGLAVEERVTAFKPPELIELAALAGGPFRNYRTTISLVHSGDATAVRWRVRFRPLVPGTGWLVRRLVTNQLGRALGGLAACSEA